MPDQQANQLHAHGPALVGLLGRPRRVQRVVVETLRFRRIAARCRQPCELEIDDRIFGGGLAKRQQLLPCCRRIAARREGCRERETEAPIAAVPCGGAAEIVDGFVEVTSLARVAAALVPGVGVAKSVLAVAGRYAACDEEGEDGNGNERRQLDHLVADQRRPPADVYCARVVTSVGRVTTAEPGHSTSLSPDAWSSKHSGPNRLPGDRAS